MEVSQEHVSAGCNRVMGPLDWGDTDVVAYGAHNLVILYDAEVTVTGLAIMTHVQSVYNICVLLVGCPASPPQNSCL